MADTFKRTPTRQLGYGLAEEGLHGFSGTRIKQVAGIFANHPQVLALDRPIASATLADWTELPLGKAVVNDIPVLGGDRLPMPCTPCVTVRQTGGTAPGGQSLQLRLTGIGQFGEHVQEPEVMMAGSVLTVLPVIVLFLCLQRYYIEGMLGGALKG